MTPRIVRLWWRCTHCGHHIDTFGVDHDAPADRMAFAYEGIDHAETHTDDLIESLLEVLECFAPAGKTNRVIRRTTIVPRGESVAPIVLHA